MKTKPIAFASLFALSTLSGAALATPASAQSAFDWSGPYIGANVGVGHGDTEWSGIMVPDYPDQDFSGRFSSDGFSGIVGGAHAGYNAQFGQAVAGVEAGFTLGDLTGKDRCFGSPDYGDYSADCTTEVNWMGELTAHLGVAPVDRVLFYVKGGAALANVDFTPKNHDYSGSVYGTTNDDRWGFVLGLGAQYAIDANLSVGVEITYRDFGKNRTKFKQTQNLGGSDEYGPPFSADTQLEVSTIVARINYKF